MVQIVIHFNPSEKDWMIIELQGVLESNETGGFNDLAIGDLHFDEKGQPSLIIGNHLLTGRVVTMEKPFAVLKKVINQLSNSSSTEYTVQALVRKKIIFKTRPKPIVVHNEAVKKVK